MLPCRTFSVSLSPQGRSRTHEVRHHVTHCKDRSHSTGRQNSKARCGFKITTMPQLIHAVVALSVLMFLCFFLLFFCVFSILQSYESIENRRLLRGFVPKPYSHIAPFYLLHHWVPPLLWSEQWSQHNSTASQRSSSDNLPASSFALGCARTTTLTLPVSLLLALRLGARLSCLVLFCLITIRSGKHQGNGVTRIISWCN